MKQYLKSPGIWLVIFFAMSFPLGIYIDIYEIDVRPSPRALYQLGKIYYDEDNLQMARYYWNIASNYNKIFNADYPENRKIIPQGAYIIISRESLQMIKWEYPGWKDKLKRGKDG